MLLRKSSRRGDPERYRRLATRLSQAESAARSADEALQNALRSGAALSEVRSAYLAVGDVAQEPLPAEPALDRHRPHELSRELSTLRTRRQWYLMSDPAGALAPAVVRPTSRAPLGPHVAGLDADFAERPWGVDLTRVLDRAR